MGCQKPFRTFSFSTKAADRIPMGSETPKPRGTQTAIVLGPPRLQWRTETPEEPAEAVWDSAHSKPQDGGQDSISHSNNHCNTGISLRIFLKPYFYLFTEVIHIHYNKLGKHINKKKKRSHLEHHYQAQPTFTSVVH